MASTLFSRNLPLHWKQAVMGSPWRTTPFIYATVSNLTAVEAMLQSYLTYKKY